MKAAPLPHNEAERLAALRTYEVLDTASEETFDNIAHLAATLLDAPVSLISLIDSERQWFKSHVGQQGRQAPRDLAFCAHAILQPEKVLVVPDARLDERFADNPFVINDPSIRFYAGAPLLNPEGLPLGTLCVIDRVPRQMSEAQTLTLRRLAQTAMTTLELRRAMNKARDMALVDVLTGLPNRAAMIAAVDRAIARQKRHGSQFNLLYLDLDGFKAVNDACGHAAGDQVLRHVAALLSANCRGDDLAGRLGGDEFAVVLWGEETDARAAAQRFLEVIRVDMGENLRPVSVSVGAATFAVPPKNSDSAFMAADALMYAAKNAGKNQVRHQVFA